MQLSSIAPVVQVTGASISLGGRPIVRDVDVQIQPGEVVALLGANGSGKSTLVKALVGLVGLTSGSVELFGQPLARFHDWHRLGYVSQRSTVGQGGVPATVREVVAAGRLSRRRALMPPSRADRVAVREALEAVGLSDRAHHRMATLSGGQQQRVLMARTLAGAPDLLVLDEPNAGVDLANQEAIAVTLAERARRGATILVVLHELGPFAGLIQRTLVMQDGRLVHDAPPGVRQLSHGHCHDQISDDELPAPVPSVRAPLDGGL